jgi:hypothetical protein
LFNSVRERNELLGIDGMDKIDFAAASLIVRAVKPITALLLTLKEVNQSTRWQGTYCPPGNMRIKTQHPQFPGFALGIMY